MAASGIESLSIQKLLEYLEELSALFKSTFIVLDGLEESTKQEEVTQTIEHIVTCQNARIHLFATSRIATYLEEAFESVKAKLQTAERITISQELEGDDIRVYVQDQLEKDKGFGTLSLDFRREIEETLVEKSGGMFRYATCQLDVLSKCLTQASMRKVLQMMPNTLEETCIRILCGIPDAYQQDAYKMLQWLASSVRALTLEELTEVLAINDEAQILNPDSRLTDPRDIIELCAGLITVKATNAEDEPNATTLSEVTLAHGSAKEFLLSETIKERSVRSYSINEPENHACIAESCLTYLGCLDQKLFVDEDCERFPLVRYAAWNWPSHTLRSNQNLRVIERGAQFLKSRGHNFRNWASLYDIDYASKGLASPVYYASEAGLVATLIILLEGKDSIEELPSSNCGRGSPLLVASRNGHEEVVRALLSRGANVNANDKAHQTSLHIAARKGHEGIVRMLLDHGAAIDAKDEGGLTALERAASRRQEETVRILLGHGADVNEMDQDGSTLLHKAAHVGHEALVKILLDHGADVNAKNQNGRTVLQEAAIEGYKATAEILLKYGADVNPCEDLNGRYHHCGTDLAAAAAGGHEEVVRTLLDAGADPNAQCADAKKLAEDRWEGLRFAASNQGVSISTLLEDLGTDPDNPSGRTRNIALEAARKNGRRAIEQILLSAGAKPYLSEY